LIDTFFPGIGFVVQARDRTSADPGRLGFTKNMFAVLRVEEPGRPGAKMHAYVDFPSFRNAVDRDASALRMQRYFSVSPKYSLPSN
jgi:hypothetical protein